MEYKTKQGMIVYHSKHYVTLKCNFQIMPGASWLMHLLQHGPDQGETATAGIVTAAVVTACVLNDH